MRYTGFHRAVHTFQRELRNVWQIHFCNEIEADQLDQFRQHYKNRGLTPPSYTALVVKAIAQSIQELSHEYPEINSYLTGFLGWKTIYTFDRISAGVAISRNEDGLDRAVQCVIQDPEVKSLTQMTQQLQEAATLAVRDVTHMRNCHYLYRAPWPIQQFLIWCGRTFPGPRRIYRGTFTLTSVGKFGVDYQLTLPQAACLQFGFGVVRERPVVRHHQVIPVRTFFLTLSFDRRLMNGKPCAELMERIRDILNRAEFDDDRKALEQTMPPTTPDSAPSRQTPSCTPADSTASGRSSSC